VHKFDPKMWMQNKVLGASDVYSFFPSTGSNVKGYPMYYTWCSKISQLSASLMKLANSFSQHKYFANGLKKMPELHQSHAKHLY